MPWVEEHVRDAAMRAAVAARSSPLPLDVVRNGLPKADRSIPLEETLRNLIG